VVLNKQSNRVVEVAAGNTRRRNPEDCRVVLHKVVGSARESNIANAQAEVGNQIAASLATNLQRVPATQQRCRIRQNAEGVVTSLREARGSAEVQTDVRDDNLRNTDRTAQAIADVHAGRIDQVGRVEDDRDPVQSETRFVDEARAEDMGL